MSRHNLLRLITALTVLALVFLISRTSPGGEGVPETAKLGGVSLILEYATTSADRERGLGGRASVPEGHGMLFVFPQSDLHGFWMKDMRVPIDIFWLDSSGRVVSVTRDIATSSYPSVFYPPSPVRYVLETAAGFARSHAIATGTPLILKKFPSVTE